jgi:hypothetical protein
MCDRSPGGRPATEAAWDSQARLRPATRRGEEHRAPLSAYFSMMQAPWVLLYGNSGDTVARTRPRDHAKAGQCVLLGTFAIVE